MSGVRRVLLSVTEKTGVVDLAHRLSDLGAEVVSTGGTAKILKQLPLTHHIRLIGISSNTPHDPVISGLSQLCDTWLPKPFTPNDLLLLVKDYATI